MLSVFSVVNTPARRTLALVCVCVLFVALAAVDLNDVRPVSGDDALIASVSAKLAADGVLGSPLHDGVFGADRHYFLNLPLQHFLQAVTFHVLGEGMAQARLVSLIAAVVLLCATTALAARWFDVRVAGVTALLLVVWRSGLLGLDYGLPLLSVARMARYDVTSVALLWLALLVFDTHLRQPRRGYAFGVGILAAGATLAQFHGVLVLVALAALWFARRVRDSVQTVQWSWLALGFLLGVTPYLAYFGAHAHDALAQLALVHGARIGDGGAELLGGLLSEPIRYAAAAEQRGVGQLGLLLALVAAPFLARARTPAEDAAASTARGLRTLLLVGAALLLSLALFESTKAPIYALPLLPVWCMLLAVVLVALWRRGRIGVTVRQRAALVTAVAVAAILLAEGVVALALDRIAGSRTTSYAALASEIEEVIGTGSVVAGPAQWAWGLRHHPYEEFRAMALRQQVGASIGQPSSVERMMQDDGVALVVLNDDVRGELRRGFYGETFGSELVRFLDACTTPVRAWNDPTYGAIEVRAVLPACNGR